MPKTTNSRSFWALDFDRCLGNTEALYELFATILQEHGVISIADLDTAHRQVKATGGSFNLCGYVLNQQLVDDRQLQAIGQEYVKRGRLLRAMQLPGVQDLLAFLDARPDVHYGIVTYGDPYWQRLKVSAAGLDGLGCMVVDSAYKATEITGWYNAAANAYVIPDSLSGTSIPLQVSEVVLVDDKPQAFTDIHSMTRGYWVAPQSAQPLTSSVAAQVQRVSDLTDIVQCEQLVK